MGKLLLIITAAALINNVAETKESQEMDWPNQEQVIKCNVEGISEMNRLGFDDEMMEIVCNE